MVYLSDKIRTHCMTEELLERQWDSTSEERRKEILHAALDRGRGSDRRTHDLCSSLSFFEVVGNLDDNEIQRAVNRLCMDAGYLDK
jgi:hypothetical protein